MQSLVLVLRLKNHPAALMLALSTESTGATGVAILPAECHTNAGTAIAFQPLMPTHGGFPIGIEKIWNMCDIFAYRTFMVM
jgi:hypothetical protein